MKKIIKAGSVTNLTDARFFAGYGVDYIGFCFDPQSPNYISPQQALAIKGWLHGVQIVAEFANQDADNVKGIIDFLQPDVIEWIVTIDDAEILSFDLPVILNIHADLITRIKNADYLFVLISDLDEEDISGVSSPVMINIGNNDRHLQDDIAAVQVSGSPEKDTGLKDYTVLSDIMERLQDN